MLNYIPEKILIDEMVENCFLTKEIRMRFADIPQLILQEDFQPNNDELSNLGINSLTKGKKTLHLKHFKGQAFKGCPGWTKDSLCCNYFTLDLIENCPFECTYCILQAFLNKPLITVHANLEEILENLRTIISKKPHQFFRIGTGEHSDSLALDNVLQINPHLIRFFSKLPNAVLELKTKSDHVNHLLELPHGGHTVIAFSLNPETVVKNEEHKTARLSERLEAAKKVSKAGYKLGFHFDPILHFPGSEKKYSDLVEEVFDYIDPKKVVWISMGTLRCLPSLKPIVEQRFPTSRVFLGELVPSKNGKLRYLKHIRQQMIKCVQKQLKRFAPNVPIYICMEKPNVWKNSMPFQPNNNFELERMLGERIRKNMIEHV